MTVEVVEDLKGPFAMVARASLLLVVVSLIVAGCGGGADDDVVADLEAQVAALEAELASTTSTATGTSPTSTTTTTAAVTTTTRATTTSRATTTTAGGPVDLELVDFGFSDTSSSRYDKVSFAVVFENDNPEYIARRVDVNVSWFDASGSIAGTTSESISYVLPMTSAAIGDTIFDVVDAATMEVQFRVTDWDQVDAGTTGNFETSDVQVNSDRYSMSAVFLVQSNFDEDMAKPKAVAVFRDDSDAIVGGGRTYVDFVPGGGSIPAEVSVLDKLPAASADIHIQPSNLSF